MFWMVQLCQIRFSHTIFCSAWSNFNNMEIVSHWLSGLGSELTSSNFKLLHQLLVSRVRLHQLTPAASPLCTICSNTNENLLHLFIDCECNNDAGKNLLNSIKSVIPNVTGEALLCLEFANLPVGLLFPITYFASFVLMTSWEKKMSKSRIFPFDIRSTLGATSSEKPYIENMFQF